MPPARPGTRPRRPASLRAAAAALLLTALPGCTLCKPVVGALTGPIYLAGECELRWHGGDCCAALAFLVSLSAVGAVGGLCTGIASDISWLAGECHDPTRNWHHPFRTNVDPR